MMNIKISETMKPTEGIGKIETETTQYVLPSSSSTINMALDFTETKAVAPHIRFSTAFHIYSYFHIVQRLFSHAIWPPQKWLVEEHL